MMNMVAVPSAEQRRDKRTTRSLATIQYCEGNFLVLHDGRRIGPFSHHWAACAAMIRRSDPGFVSTSGDNPEDLAIERAALDAECPDCGVVDCETNH